MNYTLLVCKKVVIDKFQNEHFTAKDDILALIESGSFIFDEGNGEVKASALEAVNFKKGKLYDRKAKIFFVGTGMGCNTFMHVLEEYAEVPNILAPYIWKYTAKDYDDAVYACKNPDGTYTLKVAIANVAHYVGANSALFQHAVARGNSTYLGQYE